MPTFHFEVLGTQCLRHRFALSLSFSSVYKFVCVCVCGKVKQFVDCCLQRLGNGEPTGGFSRKDESPTFNGIIFAPVYSELGLLT